MIGAGLVGVSIGFWVGTILHLGDDGVRLGMLLGYTFAWLVYRFQTRRPKPWQGWPNTLPPGREITEEWDPVRRRDKARPWVRDV